MVCHDLGATQLKGRWSQCVFTWQKTRFMARGELRVSEGEKTSFRIFRVLKLEEFLLTSILGSKLRFLNTQDRLNTSVSFWGILGNTKSGRLPKVGLEDCLKTCQVLGIQAKRFLGKIMCLQCTISFNLYLQRAMGSYSRCKCVCPLWNKARVNSLPNFQWSSLALKNLTRVGREPWSSGYGMRLVIWRLWVQISSPYWMDILHINLL